MNHDQKNLRRVVLSSLVGAVIEWYDFFLYGVVAGLVFNKLFFPEFSEGVGTILAFATWCPPCRVEIPELIKTSKAYADKGVLIISLAVDEDAAPVAPFVKKMGMDYPVYLAGRDITRAYQVSSIPHNAFYAKDGTLVLSEPGMADESMLKMVIDKLLSQK